MKIAIAPDSFKGCMSASQAADEISCGILRACPSWQVVTIPMADGGEGTVDAMVTATGGEYATQTVADPLGRPVDARFGILGGGKTAVIEMSAASGLVLVKPSQRNPLIASTCGVGELIRAAMDRGVAEIIIGLGGSATVDGGVGMARALGAKFLDEVGAELPEGGGALSRLHRIDLTGLDPRLKSVRLMAACDVKNPLTGPDGAARVYGPQKGATPVMVEELERALANLASVIRRHMNVEVETMPGAGAAGGLGAGLKAFLNADLKPGIDIVTEAINLKSRLAGCDLAITGEGRMDFQTVYGKTPMGVVKAAGELGIPVIAITGSLGKDAIKVNGAGIEAYFSSIERPLDESELPTEGPRNLRDCAEQVARLLKIGMELGRKAGA